jgi:citrate lyase beta subunit
VVIDLEDAVLLEEKETARAATLDFIVATGERRRTGLRINSPRTAFGCADIAALAETGVAPEAIMVPKVEHVVDLEIVAEALSALSPRLIPVIETGRGLEAAAAILLHPRVVTALFGGADFSAELGTGVGWDALAYARGRLASLSSSAGKDLIDVPFLDVKDADGLISEAERVEAIGFDGKACIHPAQVAAVNRVFTPTSHEVSAARRVLDAFGKAEGGAVLLEGKLIDRPVVAAAERTVAKAGKD